MRPAPPQRTLASQSAKHAPDGRDSEVRTGGTGAPAYALRRKLQEYYELEAPAAELRIELPKGSYRPVFVTWTGTPAPGLERVPATPPPLPPEQSPVKSRLPWIVAACLALGTLAGA